jgi:hypothetical protein
MVGFLETNPEMIKNTALMVPTNLRSGHPETDGLLEI